ncbi:hypothetical protein ACP4OV_030433 [Aristida adscensionis]
MTAPPRRPLPRPGALIEAVLTGEITAVLAAQVAAVLAGEIASVLAARVAAVLAGPITAVLAGRRAKQVATVLAGVTRRADRRRPPRGHRRHPRRGDTLRGSPPSSPGRRAAMVAAVLAATCAASRSLPASPGRCTSSSHHRRRARRDWIPKSRPHHLLLDAWSPRSCRQRAAWIEQPGRRRRGVHRQCSLLQPPISQPQTRSSSARRPCPRPHIVGSGEFL